MEISPELKTYVYEEREEDTDVKEQSTGEQQGQKTRAQLARGLPILRDPIPTVHRTHKPQTRPTQHTLKTEESEQGTALNTAQQLYTIVQESELQRGARQPPYDSDCTVSSGY